LISGTRNLVHYGVVEETFPAYLVARLRLTTSCTSGSAAVGRQSLERREFFLGWSSRTRRPLLPNSVGSASGRVGAKINRHAQRCSGEQNPLAIFVSVVYFGANAKTLANAL